MQLGAPKGQFDTATEEQLPHAGIGAVAPDAADSECMDLGQEELR